MSPSPSWTAHQLSQKKEKQIEMRYLSLISTPIEVTFPGGGLLTTHEVTSILSRSNKNLSKISQ